VVIVNTHNCTACYNGCATCSIYDPSICLTCSSLDYVDNSSTCQPCSSNCQTCASSTYCLTCPYGYVNSYGVCYTLIDYPCATQVGNNCTSCYTNYKHTNTNSCVLALTCNKTSNCKSCPIYTYLKNGKCLSCSTDPISCNFCNPNITYQCLTCAKGYYLSGDDLTCYTCASAMEGCLACSSDSTCLKADVGYYIPIAANGYSTGNIIQCPASCATCASPTCLTCAPSFIRVGVLCIWEDFTSGVVTLGPGPGTEWFTLSQSDNFNLANALANTGQIVNALLTIAGVTASQLQAIVIHSVTGGSLIVSFSIASQ
jgi:hypothetical protein